MSVAVQAPAVQHLQLPRRHPSTRTDDSVSIKHAASLSRRPLPTPPTPTTPSTLLRGSSIASSMLSSPRHDPLAAFATLCSCTRILSCLLRYLTWPEFAALHRLGRAVHTALQPPAVRDVVFSRFVPGYAYALRMRDARFWEDSLTMTYADLTTLRAFLSSLFFSLQ